MARCGQPGCVRDDAEQVCGFDGKPICPGHIDPGNRLCTRHRRRLAMLFQFSPKETKNAKRR